MSTYVHHHNAKFFQAILQKLMLCHTKTHANQAALPWLFLLEWRAFLDSWSFKVWRWEETFSGRLYVVCWYELLQVVETSQEKERERENSGCAQPDGHAWPKPGCLINLSGKNCFTWDSTSTRQRFLVLESCASLTLQLSCRSVQGIFGLKRFGIWQGIVVLWRTVCPRPLPSAWAQWSTSPSSLHHLAVLQCVPENRIWLCLSVGNLQNFLILQWNSIPPWSTSKLPPIPELLPLAQ